MYHYRIYCTDIVSDIDFMQAVEGDGNPDLATAITIREGKMPDEFKFDKACYSHLAESVCYLSNNTCYLYIPDGNTIIYEKKPNVDHKNLRNYILGWGMSMAMLQRKVPVIHCSALTDGNGAYLISGSSGSGKSTVTTGLLNNGLKFLADDTSAAYVDKASKQAFATHCYPYRKLCRGELKDWNLNEEDLIYIDEDKDKFLVPYEDEYNLKPVPIKALIFIEKLVSRDPNAPVTVGKYEITGIQKIHYFYKALFLSRLLKENENGPFLFQLCLDLAGYVPVYVVTRPVEGDTRQEILDTILSITQSLPF